MLNLRVYWATNNTGVRQQWVQGSGGTQFALMSLPPPTGSPCIIQSTDYGSFTTNSATCVVYQNSGADLIVYYAVVDFFRLC